MQFWRRGEPFVWASGGALAMALSLTVAMLLVVLVNGAAVFWPWPLVEVRLGDGRRLLAIEVDRQRDRQSDRERIKFKVANKEYGPDFVWVDADQVAEVSYPPDAFVLERMAFLNYHGYLKQLDVPTLNVVLEGAPVEQLAAAIASAQRRVKAEVQPILAEQAELDRRLKQQVEAQMLKVKYQRRKLLAAGAAVDQANVLQLNQRIEELEAQRKQLLEQSDRLSAERQRVENDIRSNVAVFVDSAGREKSMPLVDIVRGYCPNQMGLTSKLWFYVVKVWELIWTDPRESNQDGGLFPAIFGTVLMVLLMAIACFPLGVLAGIFLGEYAREGPVVRVVRIAVANLSGIPSIVYGIFGLGFFVYVVGGSLDRWFYPERVTADIQQPVFGQGCILWASLTLGLLTIPVVIVATEEAIRTIPQSIREGSYALGATKFQTLCRVLLPMSSPGIMTGFILAMARAAGEVAPLMITGMLKSAPVPVSSQFPFIHLERKFMHLGYHILDISCKSPNVEANQPMIYATTLLLLVIVLSLCSTAIYLRNRMRKRYQLRAI
jgi:phosphate transport system permease protein